MYTPIPITMLQLALFSKVSSLSAWLLSQVAIAKSSCTYLRKKHKAFAEQHSLSCPIQAPEEACTYNWHSVGPEWMNMRILNVFEHASL